MNDDETTALPELDIGDYCRRVEDHLTRANAGHLVRIVGPGFELVRHWAESGVPLSVVFRGIDMKAERHREGKARRPLRIEFCDADVRSVFDNWRRAVGLTTGDLRALAGTATEADESGGGAAPAESKRPSLSRHLDRAIDRLSRAGGRFDLPSALRDECDRVLQELAALRASASKLRGAAREEAVQRLAVLDADLAHAVSTYAPEPLRAAARADALADLQPYRTRLGGEVWQRSVDVTTDRLVRERLGLPWLEL